MKTVGKKNLKGDVGLSLTAALGPLRKTARVLYQYLTKSPLQGDWFILKRASTVLGAGGITLLPEGTAYISGIYVKRAHRGQQHAPRILKHLEAHARSHAHITRIMTYTHCQNIPSMRALIRAGYSPTGETIPRESPTAPPWVGWVKVIRSPK